MRNQEVIRNRTVIDLIGHTPLVKLKKIVSGRCDINLYGKLEGLNPGGSIKDRSSLSMVRCAVRDGLVSNGGTVIESSSGNMAIGMAQVCSVLGLKFHCVTDVNALPVNIKIISAYGGKVDIISDPDPETGELLPARLKRVRELVENDKESVWINQYESKYNAAAHWDTMDEIQKDLDYNVDYVFCGMSSCGTLKGLSDCVKEKGYKTKLVGVDALGSMITDRSSVVRRIPGMGAGIVPKLFSADCADHFLKVSDIDCIRGCRRLLKDESIFCGGSSGGILHAFERFSGTIRKGANCVLILPDRGERYLDTVYSDEWVRKTFGANVLG